MSWDCPYERRGHCERLKRECKPLIKGCILDGKVKQIDVEERSEKMAKTAKNKNIETLDLRSMPPFQRHQKIFKIWDTLKSGETLRIINDHDPKPLWYQFEVEYKDKYQWEYQQKGPKDWIVNIKRRD